MIQPPRIGGLLLGLMVATAAAWAEETASATIPPATVATVAQGLEGTWWSITLSPLNADQDEPKTDTVTFQNRQLSSAWLGAAGYPAASYTARETSEGVIAWETMQVKEGDGVAFWRGEVTGASMRGALSWHPLRGPTEDYALAGERKPLEARERSAMTPTSSETPMPAATDDGQTPLQDHR